MRVHWPKVTVMVARGPVLDPEPEPGFVPGGWHLPCAHVAFARYPGPCPVGSASHSGVWATAALRGLMGALGP